ncbi:HIT domain-containing protein [Mycena indigotica]|uniref:HIT domain-containing protein n=1 Tax=Mycena indigotica TaxID=2126181 RepID=A0A8H6SA88_9AGAR|nr:HIT domain-containing protein [Mycena indigotica]KAF7294986.1 HIT domain-containing protein [Mycena indigotica]
MLPAPESKGQPVIDFNGFSLIQSDDGASNGTGLWLGAQVLSAFLGSSNAVKKGMHVMEFGSGLGLTALYLAEKFGCKVVASDLPWVISKVLAPNISNNIERLSGTVLVRELDWTIPPGCWLWDHPTIIASPNHTPPIAQHLTTPFDLVLSADTIYRADLITPLLRSLHAVCTQSLALSNRSPIVFVCLERRDPLLTDKALKEAEDVWGFSVHRLISKGLRYTSLSYTQRKTQSDVTLICMSALTVLRGFALSNPAKLPASVVFSFNQQTLSIFDAYPKATFHFLVLPRVQGSYSASELSDLRTLLSGNKQRAKEVVTTLERDAAVLRTAIESEMIKLYGFTWPILTGFHAVPSMAHLHLHVISNDFISERLKVKKHYNSFHPSLGFFLPVDDVLSWFDAEPSYFTSMAKLNAKEYEPLLKEDLVCWRCDTTMKNMPTLKMHLQEEWDKVVKREKAKLEKKQKTSEVA